MWKTWLMYDAQEGEIPLGEFPTLALAVSAANQYNGMPLKWIRDQFGWWTAQRRIGLYMVFET